MTGDIGLYEVWVKRSDTHFRANGRRQVNGKRRTFVNRMLVAAFSRRSAESLALSNYSKFTSDAPLGTLVVETQGRVHDLGMYAVPNHDLGIFEAKSAAADEDELKKQQEHDHA